MTNQKTTKKHNPELIMTNETITSLLEEKYLKNQNDQTVVLITDPYGYNNLDLKKYDGKGIIIEVRDNKQTTIDTIIEIVKNHNGYNDQYRIIGIGGCTALDIARAYAKTLVEKNKQTFELYLFPTIISTSCISVDKSVIQDENGNNSLKDTVPPLETIISISTILSSKKSELKKWLQSGFGDLFANISASIDMQYKKNDLSYETIKANVPEIFKLIAWVNHEFSDYNQQCLKKLSQESHASSLGVIQRGDTLLSAGGEHKLYHILIKQQKGYTREKPTHGQLVAIGTILAAKILEEKTNDRRLYDELRQAYKILGLPLTYEELEKIGVEKNHLVKGLQTLATSNTFLGDYFLKNNYTVLDKVFMGESK
ncbi:MAG: iron-containing alcohol dehydrogenase [Candidatus Woesearchaeota archaeon]